jgi:hypothetical protein
MGATGQRRSRGGQTAVALVAIGGLLSLGATTVRAETTTTALPLTVPPGAYGRSDGLLWLTLGFSVLHHTDHVIRDNHSGFPFTDHLTALTPTLLVYPLALGGYFLDAGPLYWTVFDAAALAGVVATHAALEPPHDVYAPWADGSNLTGARSPVMGGVALGILGGLVLGIGSHLVSTILDGARYGFTWKRKPIGAALPASRLAFGLTPDGRATLSFTW